MPNDDLRGRFVWYELLTTDPEAAQDFYPTVVGWDTEPWEPPDGGEPYVMWKTGERPIGGVMQLPDDAVEQGAVPHWLPYVGTPDVDSTVERAKELGSRVYVEPLDIPTVGRFAVLADPQGAVFAVYTPEMEAPAAGPPQRGDISWHELVTTDWEAAFAFYHELFGWEKKDAMDMGEMGIYQMYGRRDGIPLGGMFNKSADMPGPAAWLIYAMVDDVNTATEQVKASGGQVLNGPMEVPGGDWVAQCMDPQGAAFAVHHTAGEGA